MVIYSEVVFRSNILYEITMFLFRFFNLPQYLRSWSEFRYVIAPIDANEWANPDSGHVQETNCYQIVDISTKQKGDIIAFQRTGNSGHMGIVSTGGDYISAQELEVKEDEVNSFLRSDASIVSTTVWRYTC